MDIKENAKKIEELKEKIKSIIKKYCICILGENNIIVYSIMDIDKDCNNIKIYTINYDGEEHPKSTIIKLSALLKITNYNIKLEEIQQCLKAIFKKMPESHTYRKQYYKDVKDFIEKHNINVDELLNDIKGLTRLRVQQQEFKNKQIFELIDDGIKIYNIDKIRDNIITGDIYTYEGDSFKKEDNITFINSLKSIITKQASINFINLLYDELYDKFDDNKIRNELDDAYEKTLDIIK